MLKRRRRWARIGIIGPLAACCLLMPVAARGSIAARPAVPSGASRSATSTTEFEGYAASLRKQLGFRSDLAYVRSVQSGETLDPGIHIPLTGAEAADMVRRGRLSSTGLTLSDGLAASSNFAGVWIDQAAGGVLHVAFTSAPSNDESQLIKETLPSGSAPVISIVKYSQGQLQEALERVSADASVASAAGDRTIQGGVLDVASDSVQVSVPQDEDSAAEARIAKAYGPIVTTVREPEYHVQGSRDQKSAPPHAGGWINHGTGGACTLGYADLYNSLNQWYVVTAGHCGPNGPTWYAGSTSGGITLGQVHASSYGSTGTIPCDCLAIGALNASYHRPGYFSDNNVVVNITAVGTIPGASGTIVCQDGANSYEHLNSVPCGDYVGIGFYSVSGAFTLNPALKVIIYSQSGDSGAPLISTSGGGPGTTLFGILSGGSGTGAGSTEYFSEQSQIASRFSATFKFN